MPICKVLPIAPSTYHAHVAKRRDPAKLSVKNSDRVEFACGAQKPTLKINLVHSGKPDAAMKTAGDITLVELP